MKKGKIIALVLSVVMTIAILTGCTGNSQEVTLKVSEVTHSVFYAPQYVAINNGYFKEEGINIELINSGGADKVMTAILSGGADIGFCGPEAAIYVYNEGKENYCEVFAQVTKRDGSFLISREKFDQFTWDLLRDKTVLPGRKGGVPYMTLEHVIKSKGLTPRKDVKFDDSIQFNLMASSFSNGNGDFVTAFEPVATSLEKSGKGTIVASIGKESGEVPYTAYFATKNYIKDNPDIIERFVKALYKGQIWVKEHSAKEIAEAIKTSFPDTDISTLETVVARYKDIDAWNDTPVMLKKSFEKLQDIMTEANELKQRAPFEKLINNTFGEKIINK